MKQQRWEAEKRKRQKRRSQRREGRRKKIKLREKVEKSRNTVFFQGFVAKRRVWSHLEREMRDEKLHAVVALSTFRSQKAKNTSRPELFCQSRYWKIARRCGAKHIWKSKCKKHSGRNTFGSWYVEKVHGAMARSTFPSENVQNAFSSGALLKVEMNKNARRCDANYISKSKW